MDLSASVETIKGVGPRTAEALARVNLKTIGDLLYMLPRVYENYQATIPISELQPGKVMIRGKISELHVIRTNKKRLTITQGTIRDDTGALRTVWFNQPYRARQFSEDREYYFTGKYELKSGRYQLTSPSATLVQDVAERSDASFQPIYGQKSSLKPETFRKIMAKLRPDFAKIPDLLPFTTEKPDFVRKGSRAEALFALHFPENPEDTKTGRKYLAYEELFELILAAKLNKQENRRLQSIPLAFNSRATQAIVRALPFQLTSAQRRATWEILQELERELPMNRLLQGDVGSGKTVVAALAAAQAAQNGHQVALLAPTAILATQHYEGLLELFTAVRKANLARLQAVRAKNAENTTKIPAGALRNASEATPGSDRSHTKANTKNPPRGQGTPSSNKSAQNRLHLPRMALLTGATTYKRRLKNQIKNGEIDLVIGTHALITDDTAFKSLAFCIIDEQHRFGVNQRHKLLLKSPKNTAPHLLSMTATPIPRSLQLTIFGDLDSSLLDELPAGRQPITTKILSELEQADELYPEMRKMLEKGQQIYWICQLIEESKVMPATAVKTQLKKLKELFPKYSVECLHGKMKPEEKEQIMNDFAANKIQILVSTTVVEVGVNVPNANMMIIQDAERYGLAQLHQLRGRVGRGDQAAYCYLLTTDEKPTKRLKEMEKSTDGFHLAEVDLKIRGPGEIYGSLQHGALNLQVANLSDTKLIAQASNHASEFAKNPENMLQYPELASRTQKYQQLTTLN